MIETDKCIVVPPATNIDKPIVIELEKILLAEIRQEEVATVTKETAPELLYFYNKEWLKLHMLATQLTAAKVKAEKELQKRRSVLLLDLIPQILSDKGVNSTADTREAAILLDSEYIQLSDVVDNITAATELVKGKLKGFENSFTAVKRLISDTSTLNQRSPNMSGDTYGPSKTKSNTRPGFGVPRY